MNVEVTFSTSVPSTISASLSRVLGSKLLFLAQGWGFRTHTQVQACSVLRTQTYLNQTVGYIYRVVWERPSKNVLILSFLCSHAFYLLWVLILYNSFKLFQFPNSRKNIIRISPWHVVFIPQLLLRFSALSNSLITSCILSNTCN